MQPNIKYLETKQVYGNPDQPRKYFAPDHIHNLAASIKEKGQQQAGIVVATGEGQYMIVAGECRWRACVKAGLPFLAEIKQLSQDEIADIAIIENYQRRDISPMEEARAFQSRLDLGVSVEKLAKRLGIRRSSIITNRIALMALRPFYQKALDQDELTIERLNRALLKSYYKEFHHQP